MILRFSLYGFLKNQRYFEPFLILVFLEKGLSFFTIGALIGFREVCMNLFEIPSGAAADLYGRRRAMILSFSSYLVCFVVFAFATDVAALFAAMFFFALGEAFRSGTHKAMIFDWLAAQGRSREKARVYGFTRSWSQMGSALSVLIAAAIVLYEGNYSRVFLYSMIPYGLGLVNFLGYPAYLDGPRKSEVSLKEISGHLLKALRQSLRHPTLRRLLAESALQKATYATIKDYLQPVLKQTAVLLPILLWLDDKGRSAVLVGIVYCVLYLLSAMSARQAHRARDLAGGPVQVSRAIWILTWSLYLVLVPALASGWNAVVIAIFVALAMLQNLWRPILLERVDDASDAALGATVLSIDSQIKSLCVVAAAPLLGLAVDHWGLWPVGVAGLLTASLALGLGRGPAARSSVPAQG